MEGGNYASPHAKPPGAKRQRAFSLDPTSLKMAQQKLRSENTLNLEEYQRTRRMFRRMSMKPEARKKPEKLGNWTLYAATPPRGSSTCSTAARRRSSQACRDGRRITLPASGHGKVSIPRRWLDEYELKQVQISRNVSLDL